MDQTTAAANQGPVPGRSVLDFFFSCGLNWPLPQAARPAPPACRLLLPQNNSFFPSLLTLRRAPSRLTLTIPFSLSPLLSSSSPFPHSLFPSSPPGLIRLLQGLIFFFFFSCFIHLLLFACFCVSIFPAYSFSPKRDTRRPSTTSLWPEFVAVRSLNCVVVIYRLVRIERKKSDTTGICCLRLPFFSRSLTIPNGFICWNCRISPTSSPFLLRSHPTDNLNDPFLMVTASDLLKS